MALIYNSPIKITALLLIVAVNLTNLTGLFLFLEKSTLVHFKLVEVDYLEDVTSYYYKSDGNVWRRGKICYQIRAVSQTGLLT